MSWTQAILSYVLTFVILTACSGPQQTLLNSPPSPGCRIISATLTKQPVGDVNVNSNVAFSLSVVTSVRNCSLLVTAEGGNYTMNSDSPLVFQKTYTAAASNYIARAQIVEPVTGSSLTAQTAAFNILAAGGGGQLTCTGRSTNGYDFVVPSLPATMQLEVVCNTAAILTSASDVGGTFTANWIPTNTPQTTITGAVQLTSASIHNLVLIASANNGQLTNVVVVDPIQVRIIQPPLCTLVTPANSVIHGQEMPAGLIFDRGPVELAMIENIAVPINNPVLPIQYPTVGTRTLNGFVSNVLGFNFCQKQVVVNAVPTIDSGWYNRSFSTGSPYAAITMNNMFAEAQNGYKISLRPKASVTAVSGYMDVVVTIRGMTSGKTITKTYPVNVASTPDFILERADILPLVNRSSYNGIAIAENYQFKFEPKNRNTGNLQTGYMGFRISDYNSACLRNLSTSYASVYRATCER